MLNTERTFFIAQGLPIAHRRTQTFRQRRAFRCRRTGYRVSIVQIYGLEQNLETVSRSRRALTSKKKVKERNKGMKARTKGYRGFGCYYLKKYTRSKNGLRYHAPDHHLDMRLPISWVARGERKYISRLFVHNLASLGHNE